MKVSFSTSWMIRLPNWRPQNRLYPGTHHIQKTEIDYIISTWDIVPSESRWDTLYIVTVWTLKRCNRKTRKALTVVFDRNASTKIVCTVLIVKRVHLVCASRSEGAKKICHSSGFLRAHNVGQRGHIRIGAARQCKIKIITIIIMCIVFGPTPSEVLHELVAHI